MVDEEPSNEDVIAEPDVVDAETVAGADVELTLKKISVVNKDVT